MFTQGLERAGGRQAGARVGDEDVQGSNVALDDGARGFELFEVGDVGDSCGDVTAAAVYLVSYLRERRRISSVEDDSGALAREAAGDGGADAAGAAGDQGDLAVEAA